MHNDNNNKNKNRNNNKETTNQQLLRRIVGIEHRLEHLEHAVYNLADMLDEEFDDDDDYEPEIRINVSPTITNSVHVSSETDVRNEPARPSRTKVTSVNIGDQPVKDVSDTVQSFAELVAKILQGK